MGAEQARPWPLGSGTPRIPLALKVAYTLFVLVVIPVYWQVWGPLNFLWFCDAALFVTCIGIWLESPLLVSMQGVGILLPQMAWIIDLFVRLIAGKDAQGNGIHFPVDFTEYMFQDKQPAFIRGLSLFHGWLPLLLVWLIWRLGYDRRAWLGQTIFGCSLLLATYLVVTENVPEKAGNVNKVFGFNDEVAQTMMPQLAWVGVLMLIAAFGVYLPTHFLLRWLMPAAPLPSATQHAYTE
jgi:hypothetical protein